MSRVGKCLQFYLKYPVEMERLYETDTPNDKDLNDLAEPEAVLSRTRAVGDTASQEAAHLLEQCDTLVMEHFKPIAVVTRVQKNLERKWDLSYKIAPRRSPDRQFWVGVVLDASCAALIPYVYCRGGRRAEDEIMAILGKGHRGSSISGWSTGSVGIEKIPIPLPDSFDSEIETDALIAKVGQALRMISAEHLKSLSRISFRS